MRVIRTCLLVLTLGVAGCSAQNNLFGGPPDLGTAAAPQRSPDISGTLTKIDTSPSGGTLRIEANPQDQSGSAKALVKLSSSTTLIRQDGHKISFADFQTGQTVQAWFTGAVADSYPVQANADTVVLLK